MVVSGDLKDPLALLGTIGTWYGKQNGGKALEFTGGWQASKQ